MIESFYKIEKGELSWTNLKTSYLEMIIALNP